MATFRDLLAQTKARIREVDTAQAEEAIARPGTVVLDVREPDEYEQGAIPGAIHIPRGHLESQVENKIVDHDAPVVVYCAGGGRRPGTPPRRRYGLEGMSTCEVGFSLLWRVSVSC